MAIVKNPTARTDIYETGLRIPDTKTKHGYRLDRSKPADDNDKVLVPKGASYFTWSINYGGTFISLTRPKQSQLTSSPFLSTAYDINERLAAVEADDPDEITSIVEDFKSEIEELMETTQDSLDNMPDGLQQGSTGELLQERIDACQEAIDNLDNIDLDFEEYEPDEEEDVDEEAQKSIEQREEWVNEKIAEIQDCGINC